MPVPLHLKYVMILQCIASLEKLRIYLVIPQLNIEKRAFALIKRLRWLGKKVQRFPQKGTRCPNLSGLSLEGIKLQLWPYFASPWMSLKKLTLFQGRAELFTAGWGVNRG